MMGSKPFDGIFLTAISFQVAELTPDVLPPTAQVEFPDPDVLYKFSVIIRPTEGYWKGGRFELKIEVPDDYNMSPPKVCRILSKGFF